MSTHDHSEHHIMPLWLYLSVGSALLFLTVVTVAVAYVDFNEILGVPHVNVIVAMIIATIKATLVALFFMHLIFDKKINLFAFLAGLSCLGIFVALTLADTARR